MKEHILAFGCEPIAPLLTQTFAPRKMAVKAVPLADYAQTVGTLAGDADRGEPRLEARGAVRGASEGARGNDR